MDLSTWLFTLFAKRQPTYNIYRTAHRDGFERVDRFNFKFNLNYIDQLVVSTIPGRGDPVDFNTMWFHQYLLAPPILPPEIFFILSLRLKNDFTGYFAIEGTFDNTQLLNEFAFTGDDYQQYLQYKLQNT